MLINLWYRQVTNTTTSTEKSTPYERELSTTCPCCIRRFGGFEIKEQELKAQILFQSIRTETLFCKFIILIL